MQRSSGFEWAKATFYTLCLLVLAVFEIAAVASCIRQGEIAMGVTVGVVLFIIGIVPIGFITIVQTNAATASVRVNRYRSNTEPGPWVVEKPCQGLDRHGNYCHDKSKHGAWYTYPSTWESCVAYAKKHDRIVALSELPASLQRILSGEAGPRSSFATYLSPSNIANPDVLEQKLKQIWNIA